MLLPAPHLPACLRFVPPDRLGVVGDQGLASATPDIRTPPPPATPRINGPTICRVTPAAV